MKISLVKSKKIDFMFDCENSKTFANLIFMLLKFNYNSNVIDLDFQGFSSIKLKDDDEEKFKKIMYFNYVKICLANSIVLFNEEFDRLGWDLLVLYKILFECKLITKHHVDKFKKKLTDENAKELQKKRSNYWKNNAEKAIESFTRIYESVSSFTNHKDADYIKAVKTYNFDVFVRICTTYQLAYGFYPIHNQELPTTTKRSLSSDDNNIDNDKRLRSDTTENTI
ncbi:unnamed protein product [Brachionus calyciflorus]|uniref:Uncharacterized protein n=1 Tax=Brachionus calyciflorus TaxID=104777 RepID=A0A813P6Q9_9BILA|nr:unnamed protein product [Brachionus calyciflorus]